MKRVVIIGGGPAGLTTAYQLSKQKEEYEIILLEESNDFGGISKTVKYNGNRMDIGGHRFFSKDQRIMNLWSEVMPVQSKPAYDYKKLNKHIELSEQGPDPEIDDNVMLVRQRVSRIYYKGKFFDYPISLKWDTIKSMGFLTTVCAGFSYLKAVVFKKAETNLENFYINRFGKKLYSMFFESYTEKLWGRHPSEISADWGSQRVKGISIKAVIKDMLNKLAGKKNSKNTETSLIEQFWYPKFGPGQLWEKFAEIIEQNSAKILLSHKVCKINVENNVIKSVVCQTEKGEKVIEGDVFVSSMPVKDLVNSINDNKSEEISKVANGLPYRDFVTVGLLLNKLNIKNNTNIKTLGDIVPDCWIYVQDSDVKFVRIQIFNNWSPYMVKCPDNTVWIGLEYVCDEKDDIWTLSDEDCISLAIKDLVKMGIIDEADVIDSHRERVNKAYPAYFDTYYQIDQVKNYLDNFENLYCVGRNGQHRYNNMDHSMLTAMITADKIANNDSDKTDIWNVNTDKDYHEEK